jgi:cell division protease FtsH
MEKKRLGRFRYSLRFGVVAAIVIVLLVNIFYPRESNVVLLGYGNFKQMLQAPGAHFQNIRVGPTAIRGEVAVADRVSGLPEGAPAPPSKFAFRTSRVGVTEDRDLFPLLDKYAPGYEAEGEKSGVAVMLEIITYLLIIGLLAVGALFVTRRWLGVGGGPFGFGRGKHRLYEAGDKRLTFDDVAGIEEAKAELKEVVDFLQDSQKYKDLGGRIPKGVLLVGPVGRRRGSRPVLQHLRQRLRGDVRRRRGVPRPRPVP